MQRRANAEHHKATEQKRPALAPGVGNQHQKRDETAIDQAEPAHDQGLEVVAPGAVFLTFEIDGRAHLREELVHAGDLVCLARSGDQRRDQEPRAADNRADQRA